MASNPYIYFAVAEATGSDPVFAYIEEGSECSYTIGMFEKLNFDSVKIIIVWYDFITETYYKFSHISEEGKLQSVIFMILASGGCVVWITSDNKTNVVSNFHCEHTIVQNPDKKWEDNRLVLQTQFEKQRQSLSAEAIDFYRSTQRLMMKYSYRFWPIVGGKKEIDLIGIKEFQSDGAIKYLNDRELYEYQVACKPQRLHVKFICDASDYDVFIWMYEIAVIRIFERFYGAHPETKTDFIIKIDAENKKYELALYRQGLKEPVLIPESAYQVIVFKNKFEDYRSENYNQPRGAWIW